MIDPNHIQNEASNPFVSAWVAASAGSGKTKVLTDRVLRLMLANGTPEKILCLTFTKVAAAEMLQRLNQILKNWATLDDSLLSKEIENLTQETPDAEILKKAKSLFAKVLEVPGGLKMMTIHSFCTSILHRFPLEADVPPCFKILEEISANRLLNKALTGILEDTYFSKEIEFLASFISQETLLTLLNNILKDKANLFSLHNKYGNKDDFINLWKVKLNIQGFQSESALIQSEFSLDEWPSLVKKYIKADGQIQKKYLEDPQAQTVLIMLDKIKSFKLVQINQALFHIVFAILEKYQKLKFKQNALDYDDLIDKTLLLLKTNHQAEWVLYKLDGGIDHILVDEAQDTNPKQWQIIEAITDDFFAGETKSEVLRTLFVVGDKKQSIYSFQGARPDEFEKRHQFFQNKIQASQNTFKTIPFNFSFRSTQPILEVVNHVLKYPQAAAGILPPNEEAIHLSKREKDAGMVEIWPLITSKKSEEISPWQIPTKRIYTESPLTQLCKKIAKKIRIMLDTKEELKSKHRPIQAGDFLILLQKRGKMMNELVRALKEQDIPVAGVDRLELTKHIAVCDLLALVRFVLLPSDDLNLACLIKSPLIGLKEEDLYKICVGRKNESVWERMKKYSPDKANLLKEIMALADNVPPFEFFEYVLETREGRKKFIARLGNEVQEALDAFLDLTLQFEQEQSPNLQTFLNWMTQQEIIIKRDMDTTQSNFVRIMTVHGSKGLQGNIVFLPDTRGIKPQEKVNINLSWVSPDMPLWIKDKKTCPLYFSDYFLKLEQQNAYEKHRLLYVALTRASDRLYICGYDGKKNAQEDNWYDLILRALGKESLNEVFHLESEQLNPPFSKESLKIKNDSETLPPWINQPAPVESTVAVLSPSKMVPLKLEISPLPVEKQKQALERGSLIHALLQYLPNIPKKNWDKTLNAYLSDEKELGQKLKNLIEHSPIKELFGPNSMAEVPVIGRLNQQQISGQIDRLVIQENTVLIIDYKTNRYVPKEVPEAYKMQLNIYKDLIKNIFPDKIVKSYLLWTENLTYTEVE